MAALHKHCPSLGLVGDLKHWDISPPVRRKLIKVSGGNIFNNLEKNINITINKDLHFSDEYILVLLSCKHNLPCKFVINLKFMNQ